MQKPLIGKKLKFVEMVAEGVAPENAVAMLKLKTPAPLLMAKKQIREAIEVKKSTRISPTLAELDGEKLTAQYLQNRFLRIARKAEDEGKYSAAVQALTPLKNQFSVFAEQRNINHSVVISKADEYYNELPIDQVKTRHEENKLLLEKIKKLEMEIIDVEPEVIEG